MKLTKAQIKALVMAARAQAEKDGPWYQPSGTYHEMKMLAKNGWVKVVERGYLGSPLHLLTPEAWDLAQAELAKAVKP